MAQFGVSTIGKIYKKYYIIRKSDHIVKHIKSYKNFCLRYILNLKLFWNIFYISYFLYHSDVIPTLFKKKSNLCRKVLSTL